MLAAHVALLAIFDLASSPWATLGALAAAFVSYAFAVHRLEHRASPVLVLVWAAILRILVLPLPPTLSDDMLRYVWDGRVVAAGYDPYSLAPEDETLAPLRDELWQRMPHKEVATVYPPLALGTFALAAAFPAPFWGVKIVLCFADLVGCALLMALARRFGAPTGRAAWYAWNPLVILEVAGQGHVDGLMVACMVAAVLALTVARQRQESRRQPGDPGSKAGGEERRPIVLAGVAAALGVLAKLVPLVALPVWARQSPRPVRFAAVALLVTALGIVPVLWAVGGVPPGLVAYGVRWEFNGPLYEPTWRAIDAIDPIDEIKAGLDRIKGQTGAHDSLSSLYPFVYPQFLAKLLLAGGFALFFSFELWRRRHPVVASRRLFGAVLLCSATVYPWYLLWVLPWAALERRRSWLVVSALVLSSYLPQHVEGISLFPWIWALIWVPLFVLETPLLSRYLAARRDARVDASEGDGP